MIAPESPMRKAALAASIALLGVATNGCASTSLYRTQDTPGPSSGDYVRLTPYFSKVDNQLTVVIAQSQAAKTDPNGGATTQTQTYTATITLNAVPKQRAYAFVKRDVWYNTSANLAVSGQGLLSSSDTASTQQVSAILTELAQTIAATHALDFVKGVLGTAASQAPPPDPCLTRLKALTTGLPLVKTVVVTDPGQLIDIAPAVDGTSIKLSVAAFKDDVAEDATVADPGGGLIAYLPSPGTAELRCVTNGVPTTLAAPAQLTFHFRRMRVDPQREFLWSPQDSFTFSGGFITGHKYTDQSPVKTVVDTVTAPVRALFPSVSVTQSTQVQTGGGKPDQTTTNTSTVTGPPKS